jgi:hypothetical protein
MHGSVRNIANQLAQIGAGWEASNDGPVLLGEPTTGSYVIDLVRNVSTVNGREANLGIATVLDKWLQGELGRLGRDRDWLTAATVEVAYRLVPSDAFMDSNQGYWTSQAFVAHLSATVTVATPDGTGQASFENAQALSGKIADPPRPMPDHYRPMQ